MPTIVTSDIVNLSVQIVVNYFHSPCNHVRLVFLSLCIQNLTNRKGQSPNLILQNHEGCW